MVNVVILDAAAHASLRASGARDPRTGERQHFVEIVPRELSQVALNYPVLATKNAETGGFLLGAVLGTEDGENLFLDQMQGGDMYRPLQLQRTGFWIAEDRLAADMDHPRFAGGDGEKLYENGSPTPYLEGVAEALRELRIAETMAPAFLAKLTDLGLLAPVDLELSFDDGTTRVLQDLYSIDEGVLRSLDDAAVLELFRRGYLQLIYAMIASLKNIPRLAKLKNERLGKPT